jgi:diamine N-acetyltransferase
MSLRIRPVVDADLHLLQALSVETFRSTFAKYNTPENMERYISECLSVPKLAAEMKNPGSMFFLSFQDAEISGYLKLNIGDTQTELKDPSSIEVERIYVLEKFQGQGVGAALLKHAIHIAHDGNFEHIWLGVWEHNTNAIAFYRKYGFTQTGEHSFFVGDDKQVDILMKADVAALYNKTRD